MSGSVADRAERDKLRADLHPTKAFGEEFMDTHTISIPHYRATRGHADGAAV